MQGVHNSQNNIRREKKNTHKVGGFTTHTVDQWNRTECPEINFHISCQLTLNKDAKIIQLERNSLNKWH